MADGWGDGGGDCRGVYISRMCLYRPYIAPISPLYLPYISLIYEDARTPIYAEAAAVTVAAAALAATGAGGVEGAEEETDEEEGGAPDPDPDPNRSPNPNPNPN